MSKVSAFDGRALVIGISAYPSKAVLPSAVRNDATDLADVLRDPGLCGYEAGAVQLLLDADATAANIRAALADLALKSNKSDIVTLFFSGHGTVTADGSSALVPVDYQNGSDHLIGAAELSAALNAIPAARLVVLFDACHSGGAASFKGDDESALIFGFSDQTTKVLSQDVGRVIISSSRDSEYSVAFGGERNSLFTTHLLEGLRGAAGTAQNEIKVFDLFNYVAEKVRGRTPSQHPVLRTHLEDNFAVAFRGPSAKSAALSEPASTDRWRSLWELLARLFPNGPNDGQLWTRAGGDAARLARNAVARTEWFEALQLMRKGGGGSITLRTLLEEALADFPQQAELRDFVARPPA